MFIILFTTPPKCYLCATVKSSDELEVVFNHSMNEFQICCKDEYTCDKLFTEYFYKGEPRLIKEEMKTYDFMTKHNILSEEQRTEWFINEIQSRQDFLEW